MQEGPAKEAKDTQGKRDLPRFWSLLWRAAVGGALGTFLVLCYAIYREPYALVAGRGLLILLLLGIANGLFIGAAIWLFSRLIRRRLTWVFRIVLGTIVTATAIGTYLYQHEGIGKSPEWFILQLVFIGLVVGGSAGAMSLDGSSSATP